MHIQFSSGLGKRTQKAKTIAIQHRIENLTERYNDGRINIMEYLVRLSLDDELIQQHIEIYSTKQKLNLAKNTLLLWTNNSNINSCTQSDVVTLDDCTLSSITTTTNTISTANTTTTTNTIPTANTTTITSSNHPCTAQEKLCNDLAGVNERVTT
ncbi:unnamed protein product, partial [Rotaria sp. Silwood1]